jgi:cation diffusion facilitator family transporter
VDRASKTGLGSIVVGVLVLALKYAAYLLTGSVALYSDALESIINVAATGWLILDPALAAMVGANILWSGWGLVRSSVGGLMDEAVPTDLLARIKAVIAEHGEGALEAHDVRTRHAGRSTFIDFHLVVPGGMRVSEAHAICDRIEAVLREEVAGAVVVIHVEPDEKAKHRGVVVL